MNTPDYPMPHCTTLQIRLCATGLAAAFVCCLPLAQAQDDELPILDLEQPLRLDFSGTWEKDFLRSDNWETELERTIQEIRRIIERQQQSTDPRSGQSPFGMPSLRSNRGTNVIDLARLAEYISRQNTMTIRQSRNEVRIQRENEADLVCSLQDGPMQTFTSDYGTEICGWERQQLVFMIELPDQLSITHRFTVSADNSLLRMVTTITSGNGTPFNLIQAFNRYDAPPDPFECEQTVSRGRVCSRAASQGR